MSGGRIKLDLDSILYGYGFLKMWVICWVLVNQVTNMDDFSKRPHMSYFQDQRKADMAISDYEGLAIDIIANICWGRYNCLKIWS